MRRDRVCGFLGCPPFSLGLAPSAGGRAAFPSSQRSSFDRHFVRWRLSMCSTNYDCAV